MNNETELVTAPAPKKEEGGFLFDALEMFVWALAVLLVLFTFAFRLCRVEGSSMENTLYEGENLILYSLAYKPQQDDIIVFHLTDDEPNLEMCMNAVLLDASYCENSQGLLDFCSELGYDEDKKGLKAYKACKKTYKALHRLFSEEELEELYEEIDEWENGAN